MQIKLHTSAPLSDEIAELHLTERLNVITVEGHSDSCDEMANGEEKAYVVK